MRMETLTCCDICGSGRIAVLDAANNICRCQMCGYIFDNPRPTLAEITAFYSRPGQYDAWMAEEAGRDTMWRRRLRLITRYRNTGRLLDVGTGTGQFLRHARAFFDVYGTEVSTSGAKIAMERYGVTVWNGALEDINPGFEFDVITLFHVLEHVPSPTSTMRRCRALLSDGGLVFVAVPNDVWRARAVLRRVFARIGMKRFQIPKLGGVTRIKLDGSTNEIHLSHFSASVLVKLLIRTGFTPVECVLDPYSVNADRKSDNASYRRYRRYALILKTLGINLYETLLLVARPSGSR